MKETSVVAGPEGSLPPGNPRVLMVAKHSTSAPEPLFTHKTCFKRQQQFLPREAIC
jgi:hypothetical protein